jgi:hypothetical protein
MRCLETLDICSPADVSRHRIICDRLTTSLPCRTIHALPPASTEAGQRRAQPSPVGFPGGRQCMDSSTGKGRCQALPPARKTYWRWLSPTLTGLRGMHYKRVRSTRLFTSPTEAGQRRAQPSPVGFPGGRQCMDSSTGKGRCQPS